MHFPKSFVNLLLLTTLITSASVVYGQDTEYIGSQKKLSHEVGVRYGAVTGTGLSYGMWYKRVGFEVSVLPYYEKNSSDLIVGGALFTILKESEYVNLLGFAGVSFTETRSYAYYNSVWNTGLGFGVQVFLFDVLSFQLLTGFGVYDAFDRPRTNIIGEAGVYYKLQ
ncbi:MAG: hypothetical protein IIA45_10305 [Bacteroidetes bacterium]|nr:hypothetical protein [Bacteroidota bacterium]